MGDATNHAHNRLITETLATNFADPSENLVCGAFTNRAGVEDYYFSVFRRISEIETGGAQTNCGSLAVSDIHLTTECFEVNRRAHERSRDNSQSLTDFIAWFLLKRLLHCTKNLWPALIYTQL